MAEPFLVPKNNATSTLSALLGAGILAANVANGAAFPALFNYHVSCENEIMRVTNRVGNTLTIVRAQEGTADVAHAAGKDISLMWTAAMLAEIQAAIIAKRVATDAIWDAVGDLARGTGADTADKVNIGAEEIVARIGAGNIDGIAIAEQRLVGRLTGGSVAGLTPAQVFYKIIMSTTMIAHGAAGATHDINMGNLGFADPSWNHSITIDQDTELWIRDPDCLGVPMCRIRMTKSADDVARNVVLKKAGGAAGTFLFGNNDDVSPLTENGGVVNLWLWRIAADTWDCGYLNMGF